MELRSEEVQELIARPPRWLLRWGITLVALVLAGVLTGAWVIRYPDVVRASFKLTSLNAPKAVLTRTEGKLVRLLVAERSRVNVGQSLAYLESTARHEDVLRLMAELERAWNLARRDQLERLSMPNLRNFHQLGELQASFQTFEQAHIQLKAYLAGGFYSQKKALLHEEIRDLAALADNLREQRTLQQRDQQLAQDDYEVQLSLAEQKVIAPLELKREESKRLARSFPLQQTGAALINNGVAQRAKQKEILELDQQVAEERDQFLQTLNTLRSAAEAWKAKYVLTAPVAGQVVFPSFVQESQHLAMGQELFYIVPVHTGYFGELRVPQQNFGKVKAGQTVLVKFAGYPFQEFGAVRGRIESIAEVSVRDSVFLAKVALPAGLTTNYGKSLSYKTGMSASAEILTDDSRLLEKLFYNLRRVSAAGQ
ncbi:MAG: HlyD family secretion protein [Cytophagaceae bacterium]|nr:HlyD family secretion protein [Cytophagaceae bacterium]